MNNSASYSTTNANNPELNLASAYIQETGCNVFLTGRAGTGKTTFLHTLQEDCAKRLVVAAPTGVAAINAGGVTLHSLFQLPFGPFLPGAGRHQGVYRFSKEKKNIIRSLDLLVIDEISMVRADMLDGIDHVLRYLRYNQQPFGGVQLLMIGDLFQLPPVVKDSDWSLLSRHYASPYFFSSKALAETEMVVIELQRVYRQTDRNFINLLNKIRSDDLDSDALAAFNARVQTDTSLKDNEGVITLCSHNKQADTINQGKLEALPGKAHIFTAEIEGDFPQSNFPNPATLELKAGAQVMFIRNDLGTERRYFNGKIGTVSKFKKDSVFIRCPGEDDEIEVEAVTWENIDYRVNEETQEITEKIIGTFRQYPLRLAWAITIHKSQGLTFDSAIIDAQAAFAHGQTYVALSRCRSLEGMILASPLSPKMVGVDSDVLKFHQQYSQNVPQQKDLRDAKRRYQQRLLLECFDFRRLQSLLRRLLGLIDKHRSILQIVGATNFKPLAEQAEPEIFRVGVNFQNQLQRYFSESYLPAEDAQILERISKGSHYFQEKIETILTTPLASLKIDTDNKDIAKRIKSISKLLQEELAIKMAAVTCCQDGFLPTRYFRAISAAILESQKMAGKKNSAPSPEYTEADIDHPELFKLLKQWRSGKAEEEGIAHFRVLHQKTLIQLTVHLPDSLEKLAMVKGIGDKLLERYGGELVEIIAGYRQEHGIAEVNLPTSSPAAPKGESPRKSRTGTREATLALHKQGLAINEIAQQRQLAQTTIETHFAHLIEAGTIEAAEIIAEDRLAELSLEIEKTGEQTLKAIKEKLPTEASYGEISLTLAHLKSKDAKEKDQQ